MGRVYVGVDDTDSAEDDGRNQGTGSKTRALARELIALTGAAHLGISRHQLFVHPDVPYTTHNSSACIVLGLDDPAAAVAPIVEAAELYLPAVASHGSDVGLCVAAEEQVDDALLAWGRRAKAEVVAMDEAFAVAENAGVHLAGLTGTRDGVIGALAAVGLRHSRQDGRFIELGDLRKALGEQTAAVFVEAGVERFRVGDTDVELEPDELIEVGPKHVQPVIVGGHTTLILDPASSPGSWRAAPRDAVKQY